MNKLENELYIFINIFAIIKNNEKEKRWIKMSAFIRLGLMVLFKDRYCKEVFNGMDALCENSWEMMIVSYPAN